MNLDTIPAAVLFIAALCGLTIGLWYTARHRGLRWINQVLMGAAVLGAASSVFFWDELDSADVVVLVHTVSFFGGLIFLISLISTNSFALESYLNGLVPHAPDLEEKLAALVPAAAHRRFGAKAQLGGRLAFLHASLAVLLSLGALLTSERFADWQIGFLNAELIFFGCWIFVVLFKVDPGVVLLDRCCWTDYQLIKWLLPDPRVAAQARLREIAQSN